MHRWVWLLVSLVACGSKDAPDDTATGTDATGTGTGTEPATGTGTGADPTGSGTGGTGTGTGTGAVTGTGTGATTGSGTGATTGTGTGALPTGCAGGADIQRVLDATPAGGTVELCPGSHTVNLVINRDVTLFGASSSAVRLDGGRAGTVITVDGPAAVRIRGVTITGGSDYSVGPQHDGVGGIDARRATSLTLNGVRVSDNAGDSAGVVGPDRGMTSLVDTLIEANVGGTAALVVDSATLVGVEISDNDGVVGGGVQALTGGTISADAATLISGNDGGQWGGGVVLLADEVWQGGTISGNEATLGGGIMILNAGGATVIGATIHNNDAVDGAGIWVGSQPLGGTEMTLSNLTLSRNVAAFSGGGLLYGGASTLVLDNIVFDDNYADDGAGLYLDPVNVRDVRVIDTVFQRNTGRAGAGITARNGLVTFDRVDFVRNSASRHGGGVALWDEARLECLSCDFGLDLDDNLPDDLSFDGSSARSDLREDTIGTCDALTGTCDLTTGPPDTGVVTDTGPTTSGTATGSGTGSFYTDTW